MTNRGILNIEELPKSLAVIGGGVVGVEFASFFSSVGVEVNVIEMLDEILPFMDRAQAKDLRRAIKSKINFNLGCKVTSIDESAVYFTDAKGVEKSVEADAVLLAVGRRPNLSGLGLEEAGVAIDKNGVVVDSQMRTNLPMFLRLAM